MNHEQNVTVSVFNDEVGRLSIACSTYPPPVSDFKMLPLLEKLDASEPALQLADISSGKLVDEFNLRLETLRRVASMQMVPIVAICGTVNSGKSTITSSFLSERGKIRVPVGQREAQGTNRFVFWLPDAWKENVQADQMEELIERASGTKPELLSNDPEQAALQHNARADLQRDLFIPSPALDPELH
ncbi:MAG: hypothetical protein KDL87_16420, partial [Verrucomicrobiae bacterium]|nr:hypothetical protein [Verrucomicrobiae bacterium]